MATSECDFELAARIAHVGPRLGLHKRVQPAPTALLVIDMQNDFVASAGLVGRSGRDVSAQKLAEQLPDFIAAARRADVLVVFIRRLFDRAQFLSIGLLARTSGAQAIRRLHAVSGLRVGVPSIAQGSPPAPCA